jgi:hypothetical protein
MSDVEDRRRRRQSAASRRKAERARAEALNLALKEPPPNETVRSNQAAAARQRLNAQVAASPKKKREYLAAAKRHDTAAQKARDRQLAEHWAALAITETDRLAAERAMRGEGEGLVDAVTEVPSWTRDEDGVLVRDRKTGLPTLAVERARPKRRQAGLELMLRKGAISALNYDTGLWYGEVCANAQIALISGREETGVPAAPASKPSPGLADWKIEALHAKAEADASILRSLPRSDGEAMVRLLVAVCFEGWSCHFIAEGDSTETAKLESRIGTGLAMLRHHRLSRLRGNSLTKPEINRQ